MKTIIIIFSFVILVYFISCDTNEPPLNSTITLKLEEVSCTEAWIELTTTNLQLPTTVTLKQFNPTGDTLFQDFILNTQDSLLYIDSLMPNIIYTFQSSIQPINQSKIKSNELSVTTMDTTSHNFTFETFTFGGTAGSSTLYDVAIVGEEIWAVGEIYVADTSQNGYTMYNAVHWDGSQWELKRIMFYTICGQQHQNAYPASSIFAFSENDIWVGMLGSQIAHLNDTTQIGIYCIPISVRKLWGSDSQNLYAVGVNGQIAFYNGIQWSAIESGTELNINDIWGDYNNKTNEWEILAVASNILQSNEKEVLKINTAATQIINKEGITGTLSSVWLKNSNKYYVSGGGGVYENNSKGNFNWQKSNYNFIRNFLYRLRGNELNDIVAAGGYGDVLHFNGVSWKSYYNDTQLNYGNYYSVAINNNIIVSVGQDNPYAVIIIGRRN
jgi:hypothetical protein